MEKNLLDVRRAVCVSTALGLLSFNFDANAAIDRETVFGLAQNAKTSVKEVESTLGGVHKNTLMMLLRARDANGFTPLVIAVKNNQMALISFVIKHINNPDRLWTLLSPALECAISSFNETIVNAILRRLRRNPDLLYRILRGTNNAHWPAFHSLLNVMTKKKFRKSLEIIWKTLEEEPEIELGLLEMTDSTGRNSISAASAPSVKESLKEKLADAKKRLKY